MSTKRRSREGQGGRVVGRPLCTEAGVASGSWELMAPRPLAKAFSARFVGEPRAAARKAAALIATQRDRGGGGWRSISIAGPMGGDVRVYIDSDNNSMQPKEEEAMRKLLRAFRAASPDGQASGNRGQGATMWSASARPSSAVESTAGWSGAPSCGGLIAQQGQLRVWWWNARALPAAGRSLRARKVGLLRRLCDASDVVVVAEVLGGEVRAWRLSKVDGAVAGGMLVLERREAAAQAEVEIRSFVEGRAVAARLKWRTVAGLSVVGMHNFGMTAGEQHCVSETIRQAQARAPTAPSSKMVAVAGDWNSLAPGDGYSDPARPAQMDRIPAGRLHGQHVLGGCLAELVDVGPDVPTHCGIGLARARLVCTSAVRRGCSHTCGRRHGSCAAQRAPRRRPGCTRRAWSLRG